ncbi:acyltransferase family protein [Flavitalea flava]
MDYLRGFITVLVVAHHSSLAYTTFASFHKEAYILSTHPVVDTARSSGLDLFEDFNDVFFMSLMFLISGVFILQSLARKGKAAFIRDRFYRLFIPFALGVTVLMLAAYYPAWLLAHDKHVAGGYISDFFTVEAWPVGPPWFIWVLFAFNLLFAVLYPFLRNAVFRAGEWLVTLKHKPIRLFLLVYLITWILYIPAMLVAGPDSWTGFGPFDFQLSRALLYFGYFILGVLIGSPGLAAGIFADGSSLVRKWPVWVAAGLFAYVLLKGSEPILLGWIKGQMLGILPATLIYRSLWVLSCTASSIAFLTLFKTLFSSGGIRHIGIRAGTGTVTETENENDRTESETRKRPWWDSLSANAYGIYLLHYIFVIWTQYALLAVNLPAVIKFFIAFMVAVSVSWWLTSLLRRMDVVRKFL